MYSVVWKSKAYQKRVTLSTSDRGPTLDSSLNNWSMWSTGLMFTFSFQCLIISSSIICATISSLKANVTVVTFELGILFNRFLIGFYVREDSVWFFHQELLSALGIPLDCRWALLYPCWQGLLALPCIQGEGEDWANGDGELEAWSPTPFFCFFGHRLTDSHQIPQRSQWMPGDNIIFGSGQLVKWYVPFFLLLLLTRPSWDWEDLTLIGDQRCLPQWHLHSSSIIVCSTRSYGRKEKFQICATF